MKKNMTIFIFLTFTLAVLSIKYNPQIIEEKPDAYEVVKYIGNEIKDNPNDINDFYLLFDSYKLDSKNFVSVLSFFDNFDCKIIEVYPYINPMYQNMLGGIYKIIYDGDTLNEGIANVYDIYMNELNKYRLAEETDKALVNGVKIRMLKVKVNNKTLGLFLESHEGVKYSLYP